MQNDAPPKSTKMTWTTTCKLRTVTSEPGFSRVFCDFYVVVNRSDDG